MAKEKDYSIPKQYKGWNVVSYSKLSSFDTGCKYAYYLQRIKKIKGKDSIWSYLGSVVHDIIEDLQNDQITIEEAKKKFIEKMNDADKVDLTFPKENMKDNYVKAILHYLDRYKKIDLPVKTELKMFYPIPEKKIVLIGYLDLVIKHDEGVYEIRDYKTSTKYSQKELKKKSKQLMLYALGFKHQGAKEVKITYDMLKYAKIKREGSKRSRTVQRHKLALQIKDWLLEELIDYYNDEFIANEVLITAITRNEIPKEVADKFEINNYILEVKYTDEDLNELRQWVIDVVGDIKNEMEWEPLDISENEFYCENLCGVRDYCKYYKQYKENKEANIDLMSEDTILF